MAAKRTRKKQQKQKKQEERKELVIDGLRGMLEIPLCLYSSSRYSDARPLVEVRDLGQKGLGVIAISDIPRGTRVIAESDLLQVNRSTVDAKEVVRAFEKLPLSEQNLYLELYAYASPEYKSAAERELEQSWEQIPQLHRKVLEIYAANAFGGVFLLSSRINHSCIPNLHFAYNPELLKETFHAIRDITAGEELTIMYIKGTNRTRSQRQAELNRWGFQCTCLACEDTSQGKEREKKRSQLFDLDQKLALDALMSTEASYVKSLQAAQKMAAIQQSEGLLNRDLGVS
jgi:hypothetical protein